MAFQRNYGQVAQSVERSPEKAGVGGSIPSLATTFSITYSPSGRQFHSNSFQLNGADDSPRLEIFNRFAGGLLSTPLLFSSINQTTLGRCQMTRCPKCYSTDTTA